MRVSINGGDLHIIHFNCSDRSPLKTTHTSYGRVVAWWGRFTLESPGITGSPMFMLNLPHRIALLFITTPRHRLLGTGKHWRVSPRRTLRSRPNIKRYKMYGDQMKEVPSGHFTETVSWVFHGSGILGQSSGTGSGSSKQKWPVDSPLNVCH